MSKPKYKPQTLFVQAEPKFSESGSFLPRPVTQEDLIGSEKISLSPILIGFFTRFEKSCTFDCCGVDALQFDSPIEWDRRWNYQFNTMREIQSEIERAQKIESQVISVKQLWTLYKEDWLFFLRYLEENMEKTKQWK